MENTAIVKTDQPDRSQASILGATMAPSWYLRWQFKKQDESASRKHLMVLGYTTLAVYLVSFISPGTVLDYLRPAYLVASMIFLMTCGLRKDITLRITVPFVFAIALQAWSFFTSFYAMQRLGRPLALGRPDFYIVESIIPFFVACALTEIDRDARRVVFRCVLLTVGVSCLFAWLQFARIDWFVRFAQQYTYKPIDFWDGHPGLRAVGLTEHPNCLAFQALIGFAICASGALYRKLRFWDCVGLFFFSGALVMSQGRTFYIALLMLWVALLVVLIRRDPKLAITIVFIAIACCGTAVTVAAKRLGYAFQSVSQTVTQPAGLSPTRYTPLTSSSIRFPEFIIPIPEWERRAFGTVASSGDVSLDVRLAIWRAQLEPIWPKLAMTGVGPSAGLLLGTGPEDHWVPIGHVMENGYLLMLAMYGIPGLVLFSCGLLMAIVSSGKVAADKRLEIYRRLAGYVACVGGVIIAISCASGNTVDGYMFIPLAWLIGGLAVKSSLDAPLIKKPVESVFFAGSPAV